MFVVVGVDLGKRKDPAAIVITEYQPVQIAENGDWWPAGELPPEKAWIDVNPDTLYLVRSIEHVDLGTSYPRVGRRVNEKCSECGLKRPVLRDEHADCPGKQQLRGYWLLADGSAAKEPDSTGVRHR